MAHHVNLGCVFLQLESSHITWNLVAEFSDIKLIVAIHLVQLVRASWPNKQKA